MKYSDFLSILALLVLTGFANSQNFQFHDIHSETDNITATVVLQLEATYSSTTGDVCANGIDNSLANLICQEFYHETYGAVSSTFSALQATGTVTTDYPTSMMNDIAFGDIDCSAGIDACTGTPKANCDSDGGLLAVKCIIPVPECSQPSQVILSNPVNTTIPGGYYLTGHPVTCNNGNFTPICSSVNIGPLEKIAICAYTTGVLIGGFVGAPSGVTVPPPTLRFNNTVSNQFSCPGSYLNCSGNSVMGSCPNGYSTVTCQKVCADSGNSTLFNNQTTMVDGMNYYVGIPQFCSGGTYARVCNDGTNYPGYGSIFCRGAGFAFGDLLPSNSSLAQTLYSGSPQGIVYLSNFTCSGADEDCEQNPSLATNPQCYTGQLETVLRCSPGIPCNGPRLYLHNNMTRIANGREVVAGIPLNCVDGAFYASLCNDGSQVQSGLNYLCQSMGFDSTSVILPHDSSVYGTAPVGTAYYSSFSCPPTANTVDDCDAVSSINQQCWTGTMDLVLQCSRAAPSVTPSLTASSATPSASPSASPSVTSRPTPSGSTSVPVNGVTVSVLVALILAVLLLS